MLLITAVVLLHSAAEIIEIQRSKHCLLVFCLNFTSHNFLVKFTNLNYYLWTCYYSTAPEDLLEIRRHGFKGQYVVQRS